MHFKLRVTLSPDVTPVVVCEVVSRYAWSYAWCVEVGKQTEKPHMHLYLCVNDVAVGTMRAMFSKKFGKGNRVFGLSKVVKDLTVVDGLEPYAMEYLGYMTKEGEVTISPEFPPMWLRKSLDWKKKYDEDCAKKSTEKRKSGSTQWEDLCEMMEAEQLRLGKKVLDPEWVVSSVFDYFNERGQRGILTASYRVNGLKEMLLRKYSLPWFTEMAKKSMYRMPGVLDEVFSESITWSQVLEMYRRQYG